MPSLCYENMFDDLGPKLVVKILKKRWTNTSRFCAILRSIAAATEASCEKVLD